MSKLPLKIKKNTPFCSIEQTVSPSTLVKSEIRSVTTLSEKEKVFDISQIKIDEGNKLSPGARKKIETILVENKSLFKDNLPGYNNSFGRVEASFEWASPSRPLTNRARMPDYNRKGNQLYNEKAKQLKEKGVFRKASEMGIQPSIKNNSFLVKKQLAISKSWDQCTVNDVRFVTSFAQLQDYIQTIPAKISKSDRILQICASWSLIAELDMSDMFFQILIRSSSPRDLKKMSYLCVQT